MRRSTHLLSRVSRRALLEMRRTHGRALLRIGGAGRTRPLCRDFGATRGKPIDRHYIEGFLAAHAGDIRGRVLEIEDDTYSRRFGGDRVTRQDILHLSGNARSTITGDLAKPGLLPTRAFDCIIATQTLHLIFDMAAAVRQIEKALRPGGVALITVPGITPVDRGEWRTSWYWSLTGAALDRLLAGPFDPAKVSTTTYGNLYAATAFLAGASVQEASIAKLNLADDAYPVTIAARAIA
jgi:SAM-dependent methyltransferase